MNRISMKLIMGATMIALLAGAGANAATPFEKTHPRRAEVNMRLEHQNKRIAIKRREGEITRSQARDLRAEDRGMRGEERLDASKNGGHITKTEQRKLNRQENAVSRQIKKS